MKMNFFSKSGNSYKLVCLVNSGRKRVFFSRMFPEKGWQNFGKKMLKFVFPFFVLKVAFLQKTYTFVSDFGDRKAFVRNFY